MSREIKFRFWVESIVPEETGMYLPEPGTFFQTGVTTDGKVWFDRLHTAKNDIHYKFKDDTCEFTPMQYTGLKDKNGVEIYEGDIVLPGSVTNLAKPNIYAKVVYWLPTNARWSISQSRGMKHLVIGNIYQNPDLIKYKEL